MGGFGDPARTHRERTCSSRTTADGLEHFGGPNQKECNFTNMIKAARNSQSTSIPPTNTGRPGLRALTRPPRRPPILSSERSLRLADLGAAPRLSSRQARSSAPRNRASCASCPRSSRDDETPRVRSCRHEIDSAVRDERIAAGSACRPRLRRPSEDVPGARAWVPRPVVRRPRLPERQS